MARVVIRVEFGERSLGTCQTSEPEQDMNASLNMPVAILDEAYKTMRAELINELGGE